MAAANAVRPVAAAGAPGFTTSSEESRTAFPQFRREYDAGPERKWQIEVQKKICEFANRDAGWDGAGALPVKWDAGMFALNVLNEVMQSRTPLPDVVPSPVGGVQLEWHERSIDLELHVMAPYASELWFEDHLTGNSCSMELTDDFEDLRFAIRTLTAR